MLAPPRRQNLISPSGHANRPPPIPSGGRPCWRLAAGKTLSHRLVTPTVRPQSRHPSMLALPRRQSHILPPGHANSPPKIPPGGRPCWRRPAVKAISHRWPTPTSHPLSHRRATPIGRPLSRPVAVHVGASPPANPYPTAGPHQQAGPNPACRPFMLAPPRRQNLIPPPGHANRPAQIPPGSRPCWRRPAGKALSHRRDTPTGRPETRPAAVHVGAPPPAKPYPTVGQRQQAGPNPARQPSMLAPPRRQSLIPPSGNANSPAQNSPDGRPCWRLDAGKALSHRRATPTGRPESRLSATHVAAAPCGWAAALIYST